MTEQAWVIIGLVALLAGALIGTWKQWGSYLSRLNPRAGNEGSREGDEGPVITVAAHAPPAQRDAGEEAMIDGLTRVKTRAHFMQALDAEWRRSSRTSTQFCLALVDLDRLKQINDRLGRPEGDQVLATVAAVLAARSRQSNTVARYGGDEFAILMPKANTLQAEILAERLRAGLEADEVLRARGVTVSIGIAAFPDHGRSQAEILKVADAGVCLAKHCGGNCVKVASLSPKPEDAERSQRLLEASLEAAAKPAVPTVLEAAEGTSACDPTPTGLRLENGFGPQADDGPQTAGDAGGGGSRTSPRNAAQVNPLLDTITALAFAVQAKGPYRKDHSQAVSRLAAQVALQAGLPRAEIEEIRLAGLVHDIGKIHVPEYVLQKPTLLTAQEFEIMKSHAAWGAKMLEFLNAKGIERIVLHHHERYDGKGYPSGLAGDRIPLGARIIAVAECFDIMLSDLRYKSARTFEDALAELRRCSGTQFDPLVVRTFLDWIQTQADARVS